MKLKNTYPIKTYNKEQQKEIIALFRSVLERCRLEEKFEYKDGSLLAGFNVGFNHYREKIDVIIEELI